MPRPGRRDVMMATCTLGKIRIEWAMAFQDSVMPMNRVRRTVIIKQLGVSDARNTAIRMAKDANCDVLMFWDDDVIPRSYACLEAIITTMYQHPRIDVLGGVYPMRGVIPEPIVCKDLLGGVWWGWEDGKIHKVYMTGTGFTAIRVDSLKKIEASTYDLDAPTLVGGKLELVRYFAESGNFTMHPEKPDTLLARATDDFYFAELCAKAGLSWYVHGTVVCDQIDLDGTIYKVEQAKAEFPDGPSAEYVPSATVKVRKSKVAA